MTSVPQRFPPADAAADLLATARVLWPEPAVLEVRRGAVRCGCGRHRSLLVLPSLRRPVLLLPTESRGAAVALRGHEGWQGWFLRVLARLQERLLLRRLPLSRVVVHSRPCGIEHVLEEVVGPVADVVVRLGRRRFNRAVLLQTLDPDGRTTAFVKLASSGPGRTALEKEYVALAAMSTRNVPGLRAPRPLAYLRWRETDLLVLESLLSSDATRSSDSVPVAQMRALVEPPVGSVTRESRTDAETPLADTPLVARLREQVDQLREPADRSWLASALDAMLDRLGDVGVATGAWHGDWVSWNMSWNGDEVLLWDWEHHDDTGLRGFDHVHYLAQDMRMRLGTTVEVEDRWLREARRALEEAWGLHARQQEAVIRAYLLEVNLRFVREREGDPRGVAARQGWARGLLERLDADSTGPVRAGTGRDEQHRG